MLGGSFGVLVSTPQPDGSSDYEESEEVEPDPACEDPTGTGENKEGAEEEEEEFEVDDCVDERVDCSTQFASDRIISMK